MHLARDRMGEKPLYVGRAGPMLLFGSELKALRAFPAFDNGIDRGSLGLMLQFCAVPAPHSIFENVCQLSPGTLLTLDAADLAARKVKVVPFWRADDMARQGLADPFCDEGDAIDALDAALREAIGLQMIADVPVGAFLSGGIDSSTVVAMMQAQSTRPVQTFTVGFDEAGFDEAPFAAAVARHLGTEHNELRVNAADALNVIPRLATMYDEPFAGLDPIALGITARLIRDLNTALGATSILVTHDVEETFAIADYVYFIANGRIGAQGTPDELNRSSDPFVRQFLDASPEGPVPFHYPGADLVDDFALEVSAR
jgi:asparagine synthase (glutamine-hydrolysing)